MGFLELAEDHYLGLWKLGLGAAEITVLCHVSLEFENKSRTEDSRLKLKEFDLGFEAYGLGIGLRA